jgi:hypothetical protein
MLQADSNTVVADTSNSRCTRISVSFFQSDVERSGPALIEAIVVLCSGNQCSEQL